MGTTKVPGRRASARARHCETPAPAVASRAAPPVTDDGLCSADAERAPTSLPHPLATSATSAAAAVALTDRLMAPPAPGFSSLAYLLGLRTGPARWGSL